MSKYKITTVQVVDTHYEASVEELILDLDHLNKLGKEMEDSYYEALQWGAGSNKRRQAMEKANHLKRRYITALKAMAL